MTKKRTSLKDIAEALNTSVSTVSRALKDHPDISPALKKQIQEMASERDYKQKKPSAKSKKKFRKNHRLNCSGYGHLFLFIRYQRH